jgi:hypothetical protein
LQVRRGAFLDGLCGLGALPASSAVVPPVSSAAVMRPAPSTAIDAPELWLWKPPRSAPFTATSGPKAEAPGASRATSRRTTPSSVAPRRLSATVPSAPTAIARTRSFALAVVARSVTGRGVSKLSAPGRRTAT